MFNKFCEFFKVLLESRRLSPLSFFKVPYIYTAVQFSDQLMSIRRDCKQLAFSRIPLTMLVTA